MKKFLSLLVCCFMLCGISFAEEETVEPRPYYEMQKIEFELKDAAALMNSLTKYESEGYCFMMDSAGHPFIVFVFTLTPLEEKNSYMTFLVRSAKQGDTTLGYSGIDSSFYPSDENSMVGQWTDPELTNGFKIPLEYANNVPVGESRKIALPFPLDNLEDDVTVDMAYYGVEPFTVPIPDDAFLESPAE